MIRLENLSFRGGNGTDILKGITAEIPERGLTAVIGPNGSGKTTLFRCILGSLKPSAGNALVDGVPAWRMKPRDLAARIAYIPQQGLREFDGTVWEAVTPGLTRVLGPFSRPSKEQEDKVDAVLETLGLSACRNRPCGELSGGERQLALIARAFVQEADLLLMDEPDASLDFGNRVRLMDLLRSFGGKSVLMSTHDPGTVMDHADHLMVMNRGELIAFGKMEDLPLGNLMREMYGIPVRIENINGKRLICREDPVGSL